VASRLQTGTPLGELLNDVDKLRRVIGNVRGGQIQSAETKAHIRAVAQGWFNTYKAAAAGKDTAALDTVFSSLLTAAESAPSTPRLRKQLKDLRKQIVLLQTELIASPPPAVAARDAAPPFASVPDPVMRAILVRRWDECVACLAANAPMAATVMMGGLLESLFLARVNREANQAPIFAARAAPKDKQGKPSPLNRWTLGTYIAVAHEIGWITQSGRDVSEVLQDYRNYIHPQKELSRQAALTPDDARMFWAVFKAIAQRLL
jgi:hypothetical protein